MQNYMPEVDEDIHLSDYLRLLKRHLLTIFTVFFVTVILVTIKTIMMTPVYRATATLFIDQESSNVVTISGNNMALDAQTYAAYKEYFQSQKEIIRSNSILEPVFTSMNFHQRPENQVKPGNSSTSWSYKLKEQINNLVSQYTGIIPEATPAYPVSVDPIDRFRARIGVQEVPGTRLLKLNVENEDPALAAEIANRVARVYVEKNLAYISKSEIIDLQKNEYLKLQSQLSELSKIYKHKHPKILRLKDKMEEVTKRIKQERNDYLSGANPVITATDLAGLKANNISVQDWAKPIYRPIRPNKRNNILLAILMGIFGGVALAFFLEYLDHTVKSIEDIQRKIDWQLLGYVPNVKESSERRDQIVHIKPKSSISEAYKTIRTSVLFSSTREKPIKSILLTSPGQQEGKSTTTSNLAIVMAQSHRKVLLIDADMRKPRVHSIYKTDNKRGLSTYLSGQASFQEVVQKTSIENLSVVGSGPLPPNPSELLTTGKTSELIENAKRDFDFVIFDTPPIMMVTDALILSKLVDGSIIILESGKTSRKVIPVLRQILKNVDTRVIGVVINKIKAQSGDYSYSHGYYSSYYGKESDHAS